MSTVIGTVVRETSRDEGTPGKMALENGFISDTLELEWDGNKRGTSCTKAGVYRGRVWRSKHLKYPGTETYRLVIRYADQNGRQDCLVHNANWAGEGAGEITQLHGCTSVGKGYGDIKRPDDRVQWGIENSGATLDKLIASLERPGEEHIEDAEGFVSGYDDVEITYKWADGAAPEDDT